MVYKKYNNQKAMPKEHIKLAHKKYKSNSKKNMIENSL